MTNTLWDVLYFADATLAGWLMMKTVRRFLPVRGRFGIGVLWLVFAVTAIIPSWIGDANSLYLLPFFMAAFLLFLVGRWYARLITGAVFYTLLVPLNMIVDTMTLFGHHPMWETVAHNAIKLAVWVLIWLAVRRFTAPGGVLELPPRLWALLGGLALAPLFATLTFTVWNRLTDQQTEVLRLVGFPMLPFVTLSALAILVAMAVLSRHEALEKEQMLAQIRGVYYAGLQREQTEVRTLRHDMHNHLAAAQSLLEAGSDEAALRYLRELSSSAAMRGTGSLCENEIASAVLASKAAQMRRAGLEGDFELSLPKELPVSDVDLCSLLGNALDNAMEAAQKTEDKRISVRARADKGMLMLRVENALAAPPVRGKNGFDTTKKDKKNHGFGLAGMRSIAGRYGGSLDTRAENGRFELVVYLPLAAQNS